MANTFSRTNTTHEEWKIVDKFDSTFWSGLDAQVYFNNIFINEAIQVSYMISEQIRPYYGYASYTANRIHHGARIIQGEISLNYKRDGYLFSLLQLIREQDPDNIWLNNQGLDSSASPEQTSPIKYNNTPYGPDLWEQIKSTGLPANVAHELAVKSKIQSSSEATVNRREPVTSRRSGLFESKLNGFDINIVFGGNLDSAKALRWKDGGDYNLDPIANQENNNWVVQPSQGVNTSTGLKIIGVSIGGVSKTINDDGRPIVETYAFQAKDIVILKNVDVPKATSKGTTSDGVSESRTLRSPYKTNKDNALDYQNGQIGYYNAETRETLLRDREV